MENRELIILSLPGTNVEDLEKIAKEAIAVINKDGKYRVLVTNKELSSFSRVDLLALCDKIKKELKEA